MTEDRIELRIRVDDDGVGEGLQETGKTAEETSAQVETLKGGLDDASRKTADLDRTLKTADLANAITIINGFSSAVGQSIGSMKTLGIISDDTAETLSKVHAGIQLVTATASAVKALQGAVALLNAQEAVHNALLTFKRVLSNPVNLALVGIAGTAAAGVAGAAYMGYRYSQTRNDTTVNNSITITDTSRQKQQTASEIINILGGGAL